MTNIGEIPIPKHSPHIRPSKAPGAAKKGGAGGKHTWGVPGDELRYGDHLQSFGDPNYDRDDMEPFLLESHAPKLDGRNLKQVVDAEIASFLRNDKTAPEAARALTDLHQPLYSHYIVSKALRAALPEKVEAATRLLIQLSSPAFDLVSGEALVEGISDVFSSLKDIQLDAPSAEHALHDAVNALEAADRLPSTFLADQVDTAERLPALKRGLGVALEELFVSHDTAELVRMTASTNCPEFHPIVVKHLVRSALDKKNSHKEVASRALAALSGTKTGGMAGGSKEGSVVTQLQCMRGLAMLLREAEDVMLDSPGADKDLAQFLARAVVDECVPPSFLENLPIFSIRQGDKGLDVGEAARVLVAKPQAAKLMASVWVKEEDDDNGDGAGETDGKQ